MSKKNSQQISNQGGINRSKFQETSDAHCFLLSSGFVYQSAEEAESAFKEEKKIYVFKIWKPYC